MEFNQPIFKAPSIPKLSKKTISSSVLRGTSSAKFSGGTKTPIKLKSSSFSFSKKSKISPSDLQSTDSDQSTVNTYAPSIANSLKQTNDILIEIQKQLSLDFANRISQEKELLRTSKRQKEGRERAREEKSLETVGKIGKKITNAFSSITKPVKGIFSKILEFFQLVLTGIVVNTAWKWLSKEENREKIKNVFEFLTKNWKVFAGILVGGLALRVLYKVTRIVRGVGKLLRFLRILPRGGGVGARPAGPSGGIFRTGAGQRRGITTQAGSLRGTDRYYGAGKPGLMEMNRQFGGGPVQQYTREKGIIGRALQGVEVNAKKFSRSIIKTLGMGPGQKTLQRSLLKFARPILKRIPFVGALLDFALSVALGEDPGRAAFGAIGAGLLGAIGTFIGGPVGTFIGGIAGDMAGRKIYDLFFGGKKKDPALEEMSNDGKPKKYKNGGIIPMMRLGGMMKGPSHAQGGVPLIAEGNEYIVNKKDTAWARPALDSINYDGSRSWTSFSTGVEQQQKLLKDQLATNYQFGNAIIDFKQMIKDSAQKQNAMLTEGEENKRPFLANVMSLFGATGGSNQGRVERSRSISPSVMPTRNLRPQSGEGKSGFIELPPIIMNAGAEDIELPTFTDQEEGIPSILSYDSNNEYLNIALDYYNVEGIRFGD